MSLFAAQLYIVLHPIKARPIYRPSCFQNPSQSQTQNLSVKTHFRLIKTTENRTFNNRQKTF